MTKIKMVNTSTVEVMTRDVGGIPFKYEIENIWRGYRICYYKDVNYEDALKFDPEEMRTKYVEDQTQVILKGRAFCKRYGYDECPTLDMNESFFKEIYQQNPGENSDWETFLKKHEDETHLRQLFMNFWDWHVANDPDYLQFMGAAYYIKQHLNHESPFEHGVVTFTLKNVSRSLTHQIVRHRLASMSQQSQRYIGEKPGELEFVIPRKIRANKEALSVVDKYLSQLDDVITALKQLGIKNEDIRCVYPNAMPSSISMTMNFRELKHMLELRTDSHAQDEIRYVTYKIWKCMALSIPFIWTDLL